MSEIYPAKFYKEKDSFVVEVPDLEWHQSFEGLTKEVKSLSLGDSREI